MVSKNEQQDIEDDDWDGILLMWMNGARSIRHFQATTIIGGLHTVEMMTIMFKIIRVGRQVRNKDL